MTNEKRKKAKEDTIESDQQNLVVYNVPSELRDKLISLAKLHYNNQLWKAIEDAINLLINHKEQGDLNERVTQLEGRVEALMQKNEEEKNEEVTTFGGDR